MYIFKKQTAMDKHKDEHKIAPTGKVRVVITFLEYNEEYPEGFCTYDVDTPHEAFDAVDTINHERKENGDVAAAYDDKGTLLRDHTHPNILDVK